jgi:hypothetical protein
MEDSGGSDHEQSDAEEPQSTAGDEPMSAGDDAPESVVPPPMLEAPRIVGKSATTEAVGKIAASQKHVAASKAADSSSGAGGGAAGRGGSGKKSLTSGGDGDGDDDDDEEKRGGKKKPGDDDAAAASSGKMTLPSSSSSGEEEANEEDDNDPDLNLPSDLFKHLEFHRGGNRIPRGAKADFHKLKTDIEEELRKPETPAGVKLLSRLYRQFFDFYIKYPDEGDGETSAFHTDPEGITRDLTKNGDMLRNMTRKHLRQCIRSYRDSNPVGWAKARQEAELKKKASDAIKARTATQKKKTEAEQQKQATAAMEEGGGSKVSHCYICYIWCSRYICDVLTQ